MSRSALLLFAALMLAGCDSRSGGDVTPPPVVEEPTTSDAEWDRLKQQNLNAAPITWQTSETDPFDQWDDFHQWFFKTPFLVPEIHPKVQEWIDSGSDHFEEVITNEPTGAQYRVTFDRDGAGASVAVKFVGNENW